MKSFIVKTIGAGAMALLLTGRAFGAEAEEFKTPEAAVQALTNAAAAKDHAAMETIFGSGVRDLISPDVVQASNGFNLFARRVAQRVNLNHPADGKVTLALGYDSWPFPIPLVQRGADWKFDLDAGREEILNRRIGGNELGAIRVLHSYVDAQHEYASADRDNDGILEYAQHLRSSPGKHDGLYWHAEPGEAISPFGPLIAESYEEGYHKATKILSAPQTPYHGYYFKILTKQGRHAAGGKFNYVVHGRMVAGFALVAWPAEWDNSGVMTFIVNQQGKIFEKNLGPKTASVAAGMTAFDPDPTWKAAWEP